MAVNRDKIKLREIASAGYAAYVIKDLGRHDRAFVKLEFNKFVEWLSINGAIV